MRITTTHLEFYRACKTPTPGWIRYIKKTPWNLTPGKTDVINSLINGQEEEYRKAITKTYRTQNFLSVLKTVRKTRSLRDYLTSEPFEESYNITLAKRYLTRMKKGVPA